MVNAWSLAGSIMNGTFEEDYPLMEKEKYIYESPDGGKTVTRREPFSSKREVIQGDYFKEIPWSEVEDNRDSDLDWIEKSGGFEWTPGSPWPPEVPDEEADSGDTYTEAFDHLMGDDGFHSPQIEIDTSNCSVGNTASEPEDIEHSKYWYDYTRNDPDMPNPFATDPLSDNDDQIAHHISNEINFGYNTVPPYITSTFKYEEDAILKQAEDYIAKTYELHYTGDKGTQTLDLIESIGDAEAFCRSNAIKYLSRFGKKDGKNEKDILKAIHYCTLLHHFAFINDNN